MHEQGRPQLKRDKYAQMCRRGSKMPDDDPRQWQHRIGRRLNAAAVRAMPLVGERPVTTRELAELSLVLG